MSRPVTRVLLPLASVAAVLAIGVAGFTKDSHDASTLQFVFTSDAHYGLSRPSFRGATNVDAALVNAALVARLNALPETLLPDDEGLRAGQAVGAIDFLVEGGDVGNREEAVEGSAPIQPAADSWAQFVHDYIDGLQTRDSRGGRTPVYVVPGNHDLSNAAGFHRPMRPATDPTAFVAIYNLMLKPPSPLGHEAFDYGRERFFRAMDIAGIHLQFLHLWPDTTMRARMAEDLNAVPSTTPVIVFTHDQPDVEAKHFVNPNGAHDINPVDQFENLLADTFADGPSIELPSLTAQAQLEAFLVAHPNITAYFHGNSNWHQAYDWNGPGRHARVHVVRADSPMKGAVSATDESKLSFEVVTIDSVRQLMTVRECLWNARGTGAGGVVWGDSVTVSLAPRRTT